MTEEPKAIVDPYKINPVDWFNENHAQYILTWMVSRPLGHFTSVDSFSYTTIKEHRKSRMIVLKDGLFMALLENDLGMPIGELYSPFRMLVEFKYKGEWRSAINFIVYDLMNNKVPYIRVSTKYFKAINKVDRNKINRTELKVWDRQTLTDDYGKQIFNKIPNYDDFTIEPDNKTFNQIRGNNYNLYAPFEHTAAKSYKPKDVLWTMTLMNHIFGDQVELGLQYIKVLYDLPTQKLPILVLTSEERSTGKTTFLDYIEMLFGANSVVINPQDIANTFNGTYALSNIIMIEESRFESTQATEKLKNLATQKKIMVNTKFIQQYSVPFHGHLIITSNDENKFSKVDDSEIRYWVRQVPTLYKKENHNILNDLRDEIPSFLCLLNEMEDIDTSKSRMVFESAILKTEALATVKRESRSGLHKDLDLMFDAHFSQYINIPDAKFIAKDIKEAWFSHNHRIEVSYINHVLKNEFKLNKEEKMLRYAPLRQEITQNKSSNGKPYILKNPYYAQEEIFVSKRPADRINS